jgi:hypothetical protein
MSRIPSFFRQKGSIKPPRADQPIQDAAAAIAYFKKIGSSLREPQRRADGARVWILDHRGWSHGGVTDAGLVHIANEDARLNPAPAVKPPRGG